MNSLNIKQLLDDLISQAMRHAGIDEPIAQIRQSQKPEFGHYQANGIMAAAKKTGSAPRKLAQRVVDMLDGHSEFDFEIAGPGFINIRLTAQFIEKNMTNFQLHESSATRADTRTVVIDYSAPNLAKEMHIGHLRSTVIGDTAARVLEFCNRRVVRANHVGDWGAQFGSLLAYLDQITVPGEEISSKLVDLEKFYQSASKLFRGDQNFAARAREYVVKLQRKDSRCHSLWEKFIAISLDHCQTVYHKLNISLTQADVKAESAYNDDLPIIVEQLQGRGLLTESDGAQCVFLDEFKGQNERPLPAIVRKSDGGYPYLATDLAAARYRSQIINADEVLYFVGASQQLHLRQVFAVASAAGFTKPQQIFRHLPFGLILKADGKPFKTRDGADVKLIDVLDEATRRAFTLISEKNSTMPEQQQLKVAEVVGIGAIKYAELSKNRTTDYIFDWDSMLSFEGNTAPYLQYAYTRIRSLFRKRPTQENSPVYGMTLTEDQEILLAIRVLQFTEAIDAYLEDYQANILCQYLYELASSFMRFYEHCPVLSEARDIQDSRLHLAKVTAHTLQTGLSLLGIQTVEQM